MADDEKAQVAPEQQDADIDAGNPDFGAGFDEASNDKFAPDDAPAAVPTPPPKETALPADPPKDENPPEVPPAKAVPPKEDKPPVETPPESATARAEAEGAKLPPPEEKSVIEQLPAEDQAVVRSPEFAAWFDKQKGHIQKMGIEGGLEGAQTVLDLYRSNQAQARLPEPPPQRDSAAKRLFAELENEEFVQADGSKVKLSEYLKEYGDLGEAVAVIADRLSEKRSKASTSPAESARIADLQRQVESMAFWEEVMAEHSDARKIQRSPEFAEWGKAASPAMKRLLNSSDPKHAILALDAYKEFRVAQAKNKTQSPKDRKVALHSDTVRGRASPTAPRKTETEEDFDHGFEEGLK